jgi:predicted acetylornithine/succinylornithine family transaminase
MDTYARQPLTIVSGRGARVVDDSGRELIDLVAGIAVNVLGHAHPALVRAVAAQAERLVHTSNLYLTEPQVALAERLRDSAFPSRVFFCNSGSEANDGAIKLARKWGRTRRAGAHVIITMAGAFHGRTLGALAATASARYREPFEPLPGGFVRVPYNDAEAIERAVGPSTCAVMLEPVQGESGVHPLDPGVLAAVRRLCDEHDLLLILDEVQSGMGRTGAWWAHQHEGVRPDIMTVAKGLGGGVPVAAILAGARADVFTPGDHGCTFGGGPLACAAGIAVMDTIQREHLVENAAAVGALLCERVRALARDGAPVRGVRGRGLMIGVALGAPVAAEVARAALDAGVIVNALGDHTLRLVPPLVLTREEAEEAVRRLALAFTEVPARVPA